MLRATLALIFAWAALSLTLAWLAAPARVEAMRGDLPAISAAFPIDRQIAPAQVPSDTLVLAHWLGWFDLPTHRQPAPAYSSIDRAAIRRQIVAARSMGIDGFIVDWYGPESGLSLLNDADRAFIDRATQALFAEASLTASFKVALMYDYGAVRYIDPGSRTAQMAKDLAYARDNYLNQAVYLRYGNKPLLFVFPGDVTSVNLSAAKPALSPMSVNLIYQNPTTEAAIYPYVDGFSAWVQPTVFTDWDPAGADWGEGYLNWFYNTLTDPALSYTQKISIGAVWAGFNDTLAPWRTGPPRFIARRDGQTWADTWSKASYYHPPIVQIVTWNDWEEGTAIEPGESYDTWVGSPIHRMDDVTPWITLQGTNAISVSLSKRAGRDDGAIEMAYALTATPAVQDNWVQMKYVSPALDIRSGDLLRFWFRGTPGAVNSLQVGLIERQPAQAIASAELNHVTHVPVWVYTTLSYDLFNPWTTTITRTSGLLEALFISVLPFDNPSGLTDVGGSGSIAIDGLQVLNSMSRTIPTAFELVAGDRARAMRAANWIAVQQNTTSGLVVSWPEEEIDKAWLYDQALALIVFSKTDMARAGKLAARLVALQNPDGSWYEGFSPDATSPAMRLVDNKWEGAVAWTVYALTRYVQAGGNITYTTHAISGSKWLETRQARFTDGRVHTSTEGTLDAWWAFTSTGRIAAANAAASYLLNSVWRTDQQRWNRAYHDPVIVLDVQTWGAAFAKAVNQPARALAALSFARYTLSTTSFSGTVRGLDGAGPFSVWNEGTAQYIAAGGPDARMFLDELRRQQRGDGSMPGSPDDFLGGDVWLTHWSGVAPTAWYYFAETCGAFPSGSCRVYMPLLLKNLAP